MIIVLLAICVLIVVVGIFFIGCSHDEFGAVTSFVGGLAAIVCLGALILLCVGVSNLKVIDQKIEMYQEENAKIEQQISETVKQYQEYESGIFTEVAPESAVTLVSLYPDLKADTLVQKQIEVYLENNEKIKDLKEEKINGSVKRWWLYFGGGARQ